MQKRTNRFCATIPWSWLLYCQLQCITILELIDQYSGGFYKI